MASRNLSPYTRQALADVDPAALAELASPLTDRELQVVELLAQGLGNIEIAARLTPRITFQTVKNHVSSIFKKTGCQNRHELAMMAIGRGWVDFSAIHKRVESRAAEIRKFDQYDW